MSLRRLRFASLLLAAVAALALGWGAGAGTGWHAHDPSSDGELITALRLEAPAVASGIDERFDVRAERPARARWFPIAVAASLVAAVELLRRRLRRGADAAGRPHQHWSRSLGRAPPALLVTTH